MRKIFTHKILPILALFLLIFNLIFIGNVKALNSNECGVFADNIIDYIKNLEKFKDYDYFLVHANCSVSQQNPYVEVFLFNDVDVEFYNSSANGWASIASSKSFEFYHYVLVLDGYSNTISRINNELLEKRSINNITTGCINHTGYPIYSNVSIYSDSSMRDYFYKADNFVKPSFGETQDSIANLAGGYCLIKPGSLKSDSKLKFKLMQRYTDDHSKDDYIFECDLNFSSKYYKSVSDSNGILSEFWYEIPYQDMYNFEKGQSFTFQLWYVRPDDLLETQQTISLDAKIGSVTTTDKIQDDINKRV